MKLWIIIFTLLSNFSICFSQVERLNFKHISVQEGLSNNWVRCIYHDNRGFLWFGTSDGLNRYDGYDFKVYRPGTQNHVYIGDVNVNAISNKNKDELWICTDVGIYKYSYSYDSLIYLPIFKRHSILSILEDKEQNTWFGTSNGLLKLEPDKNDPVKFLHVENDASSLSSNYVNTIYQDLKSNIWIGTRNGLSVLKKGTNSFINYQMSEKSNSLPDNNIACICEDRNNRIWIGTLQDGLALMDKDKEGNIIFNKILDGHILSLMVDYQNNLWIGKDANGGLDIINLNEISDDYSRIKVKHYQNNPADLKSICDNSICYIYEDKLKDIWIGTLSEGISFYSKREKKFNIIEKKYDDKNSIGNNHVNAFLEEDNYLWIGTEGGLDRYNKKTGKFAHYQSDQGNPGSLGGYAVYSIFKDSRGNLWVGAWSGGLNLYNYTTETFKKFLPDDKKAGSISNSNVYSICEDKRGNLWVGTLGGGLNRFDYKTESFRSYQHNDKDPGSISNNSINHVFVASNGNLYISDYTSLELYDNNKDNFTHFSYVYDSSEISIGKHIISIFEDSRKTIWIATNTGIEIFDEAEHKFIPFTINGLPEHTIQGILEDSGGNFWISTVNGISKLVNGVQRPENPVIINFTNTDGLSGNEFIKRAAYKNSMGLMYFGSSKGVTFFHPDSILTNTVVPQIVLTEFMLLYSKGNENNKYKSIFENIDAINKLDLSYHNSNFIIRFAALNFLHPEKNHYQYKLEGYDKDWIDAGNQRSVTYTNIQPGKYTFYVKGSNNDGVWCYSPKMLQIAIHPPWWGTIIFKIFLGILLILCLLSLHFIRLTFLKRQNSLLEQKVKDRTDELSEINTILEERQEEITIQNDELENHRNHLENLIEVRTSELVKAKVKAEEADKLKSSFLANMSHEIRTPMNAIYGFSGLLAEELLTKEEKSRYIKIISENCQSLLVLIDDILDISRIEVDRLVFTNEKYNVDEILINLENYFNHNNHNDLSFEFINKDQNNGLVLYNDKVRFRQVMTNLLDNANKFTESGQIKFGYDIFDKKARFFVSDTGIGIGSSEIDKIFNHFYKIENNPVKLYRGTGLGLAICKKLIEMMGGEIWAESIISKGSVFYFTLPFVSQNMPLLDQKKKENEKKIKLKNFTILVAEDTPTNYELIHSMLKPFGAEIIWAQNGQEAIDYIKNNPDIKNCIILMDIKMPVVDGFEATRQIKAINDKIPVIAVTAYAQIGDKEKILSENFDDYISKPMRVETLLAALFKYASGNN
jgi:signal transduction histidine kinase/ligand-binding sensor domain-containing protein/CheY-like chemotaxis protein